MKRNNILSVFLALMLVLAFTACSGTSSDGDPGTGNASPSSLGGTIKFSGESAYFPYEDGEIELTNAISFNFTHLLFDFGGDDGDSYESGGGDGLPSIIIPFARAAEEDSGDVFEGPVEISAVISGSPVAEIKNGKVNINIGKPKDAVLGTMTEAFAEIPTSKIDISAPDVKIFIYNAYVAFINYKTVFGSMNPVAPDILGPLGMMYAKGDSELTAFVYVDKDVKISGSFGNMFWDVNAKTGWNMMFITYDEKNDKVYFDTGKSTSGFKWYVFPGDD